MNSCDDCNPECSHLEECLESRYEAMLRRCYIDIPPKQETSPEAPLNAKEQGLGEGIRFERLRRVTGYLSGRGIDGMNDGKFAELKDRVKHG